MVNVKISELPAASQANAGDELPANQAGTTRKLTRTQLLAGTASSGAVTSSGLTMATSRLLGRTTASTGAVEEISVGSGLTFASGSLSVPVGSWVEISRATANNSATIDFTTGIGSTYDAYMVEFYSVVPATSDVSLWLRTSTNGGSSFDAGASDYSPASATADAVAYIRLVQSISNSSTYGGASGFVSFCKPSVAQYFQVYAEGTVIYESSGAPYYTQFWNGGQRTTAADVDAIRFLMDGCNITSGTFVLLGRRK